MALLDTSIVNVAIPTIHTTLGASGASLQLVVAGYTIAYAVLLVTGARLGDILGYRRVFLAGVALFTLASLGCGLAGSASLLIALRFAQGLGAAAMIPQVLSLIQRTYTGTGRARAMTIYSAVLAGGAVVGQVAGGVLISADLFGTTWRPVFLVNVPIGAALLAAGAWWLPADRGEARRTVDLHGLLTLSPAVFAFVLPLVLGQSEHWPAWVWACLAASVLLVVAFAAVERRVAARGGSPIVPGHLLRLPGVAPAIAALFITMAIFGGFFFAFAVHLQGGLRDSALRAGRRRVRAGQPQLAAAARTASRGADRGRLRRLRGRADRACRVAPGREQRGCVHLPDGGRVRSGHGGRLQPADDPDPDGGAGRRRPGRDRCDRHRRPACAGGGGGDVRHPIPQHRRAPAVLGRGRLPAALGARRDGDVPGAGGRGGGRRGAVCRPGG